MGGNASELAQVVASWVPALPEATARDLHRLFGHDLAAPSSGAIRYARLGLLIALVSDLTGEMLTCERYEDARADRAERGEAWPAHSTLIRDYGHWLAAVKAAMRHAGRGSAARVPGSLHHARFRTAYRQSDVEEAIKQCRDDLSGQWPGQWEYLEWAPIRRRLARLAGLPEPRLPGLRPLRKLFGDWDNALRAAQARYGA